MKKKNDLNEQVTFIQAGGLSFLDADGPSNSLQSCHNKVPETGKLKQEFIFSQIWRLEVWDQVNSIDSSELAPFGL